MKKLALLMLSITILGSNLSAVSWRGARAKAEKKRYEREKKRKEGITQELSGKKRRSRKKTTKPVRRASGLILRTLDHKKRVSILYAKQTLEYYAKHLRFENDFPRIVDEVRRAMSRKVSKAFTKAWWMPRFKHLEMKRPMYEFCRAVWVQTEKFIEKKFLVYKRRGHKELRKQRLLKLKNFFTLAQQRVYEDSRHKRDDDDPAKNYKKGEWKFEGWREVKKEMVGWIKQISDAHKAA